MASGTPPRRRRAARTPQRTTLPLVPILIAVIVVGFGIGAALSLFNRKPPAAVAVATTSPSEQPLATEAPATHAPLPRAVPSRAPVRRATPAPTAQPATPAPSTPAPERTAAAPGTFAPTPEPAAPSPAPATAAPVAHSSRAPQVAALPREPARTAPPTLPPAPPPPPPPTLAPTAAPDQVDSDFARLSAGVVRAYLSALARGDDAAAYASFGADPGDSHVKLSEKAFADPSMRITHIDAKTGTSGERATVNVDVTSSSGSYFAQFFLHRTSTGAAVIDNHSFIKP